MKRPDALVFVGWRRGPAPSAGGTQQAGSEPTPCQGGLLADALRHRCKTILCKAHQPVIALVVTHVIVVKQGETTDPFVAGLLYDLLHGAMTPADMVGKFLGSVFCRGRGLPCRSRERSRCRRPPEPRRRMYFPHSAVCCGRVSRWNRECPKTDDYEKLSGYVDEKGGALILRPTN